MKENIIKFLEDNQDKHIALFSDMDGVIAQFAFAYNNEIVRDRDGSYFLNKEPINTVINFYQELRGYSNLDFYILSACIYDKQALSKSKWLETYAPFFTPDKQIYVVKERLNYNRENKSDIKTQFIADIVKEKNYDYVLYFEDEYEMLRKAHKKLGNKIVCIHISNFLD